MIYGLPERLRELREKSGLSQNDYQLPCSYLLCLNKQFTNWQAV